jgi:hypothetical protein
MEEEKTYLTLIRNKAKKRGDKWLGEYLCECGKSVFTQPFKFNKRITKSCGCKNNEIISKKNSTHGLSKHPLFSVWAGIIARCYSGSGTKYRYYGERGVKVCEEWKINFKSFYDWAINNGWEKGKQIDKDIIPRKLGIPGLLYSPELCCIVTNKENCNSRRSNRVIEYNGETKNLSQWADSIGINQKVLGDRIFNWGIEKALTTPKQIVGKCNGRQVVCVSNGRLFESVIEVSRTMGIGKRGVAEVLSGKRKMTKGLIFKYLN